MKITDEMVAAAASAYYNSKVDHDIDLAFRLTIEAALAASPASAEPVTLIDRIEDLIAEFGEKSLPMIGEAIGKWRQSLSAGSE